ncbi:MAG: hypothetical protein HY606_07025 [Planctomycetes bacterium]|nr:hypothetical protein [Planctomycetota bacterium]
MCKKLFLVFLIVLSLSGQVFGQAESNTDKSAQMLFGSVVNIIVKWVFPILSLFCGLYGVGRGIKKGEWDFAVMCIGAAIVLAVLPSAVQALFGIDFGNAVKAGMGK